MVPVLSDTGKSITVYVQQGGPDTPKAKLMLHNNDCPAFAMQPRSQAMWRFQQKSVTRG